MATLVMPTFRAIQDHCYNLILDNLTFTLEFHLNVRANRWSFHLFDAEDVAIRHGIRLVTGIDLLRRISAEGKPPGQLIAMDTTGAGTEPDKDTLGTDVSFRYIEAV